MAPERAPGISTKSRVFHMTTHFTSHFRRPVALLAGLSLVVGLFVITPVTTSAQTTDPEPDYLASFDACPEDVIPDADFTDVSSRHRNVGDIDCIAYYGITMGTSARGEPPTFSPDDPVIREHMALFLTRLARKVGIDLPPPGTTPFTDTANLIQESRDAISQIYQLRITIGATTTTYAPARNVSRGEMALFLARLMNLMDPVADRRDAYGYIPDDVDDNVGRFDIESPYRDLGSLFVETFDAVTHLYELGVGSGISSSLYGPGRDMSRAAMAEFMAGILDHSTLRPQGVNVQVTPTQGLDAFEIVMMISVRDSSFVPVDDQPVDWFYTDDEDGGLDRGVCDEKLIKPGNADCVWDEDRDDETVRDGNIFEDGIEATPGETMTFYAWIGRRDGDEFEEHTVNYSKAEAHSAKGADSIGVTWRERDIPPNALEIEENTFIADLGIDSVEFTIQLQDDQDNDLELEGIEVAVDVDSSDLAVSLLRLSEGTLTPSSLLPFGDQDESETTVVTDDDGEAFFELDAPRRDERLDAVTFTPDCQRCEPFHIKIAWSEADPVLVAAHPEFDFHQFKSSRTNIGLQVRYQLYDQYGEAITAVSASRTGRPGTTARGKVMSRLYSVGAISDGGIVPAGDSIEEDLTFSGGRFTKTLPHPIKETSRQHEGFLVVLTSTIFSDRNSDNLKIFDDESELSYTEGSVVVWFVVRADNNADPPNSCPLKDGPDGVDFPVISVDTEEREFRTCFTLWSYDANDRFLIGGDDVTLEEFELALGTAIIGDLSFFNYFTRSSDRSIFQLSSS